MDLDRSQMFLLQGDSFFQTSEFWYILVFAGCRGLGLCFERFWHVAAFCLLLLTGSVKTRLSLLKRRKAIHFPV